MLATTAHGAGWTRSAIKLIVHAGSLYGFIAEDWRRTE